MHIPLLLFNPLLHRFSCFINVYFAAFTENPVNHAVLSSWIDRVLLSSKVCQSLFAVGYNNEVSAQYSSRTRHLDRAGFLTVAFRVGFSYRSFRIKSPFSLVFQGQNLIRVFFFLVRLRVVKSSIWYNRI